MKPYLQQNYYELLEVPVSATMEEIRSAYDRAREMYGPDSVAVYALEDPAQVEKLQALLLEAMEILTDDDLRSEYDKMIGLAEVYRPRPVREVKEAAEEEGLTEQVPTPAVPPVAPLVVPVRAKPEVPLTIVPHEPVVTAPVPFEELPPGERSMELDISVVSESTNLRMEDKTPVDAVTIEHRVQSEESAVESTATELVNMDAPAPIVLRARPKPVPEEPAEPPRPPTRETVRSKLEIPADAEFNGELLRQVRENRGWTLQNLADRTRIAIRHLENVEADRYSDLPAAVYLRGILMNIARELGLDALRVSKSYLGLVGKTQAK